MTPQLRFPEFTDKWQAKKLGDIGAVSMCKRIFKEQTEQLGDIPFFKIGTFGKTPDAFIEKSLYEEYKQKYSFPELGDILISAAGTIGRLVVYDGSPAYFQDSNIVWIANDESKITNKFLFYCYLNTRWTTEDTTIARLYNDNLKKITIAIPPKPEQQKIADYLGGVDSKLASIQNKVAAMHEYKKGVMQALFSGKLRFKDENGNPYPDWEEKKLGDLGATYNGLTGKTALDFGAGSRFITYKQIFDSSVIDIEKSARVRIAPNEKQNQAKKGDVFFTTSSETPKEVGFSSVLLEDAEDLYLNSFCFGYRIKESELSPNFARFLFRSSLFRKKAVKLAQGSTRYNLSKVGLMKTVIDLPCLEEQQKIADFLTALDDKIKLEEAKLASAKEFKKALLQRMFV